VFQSHNENSPVPFVHSPEELQHSLSLLSVNGLSHFELEDMFEEASNCQDVSSQLPMKINVPGPTTGYSDGPQQQVRISVVSLIAGSDSFRNHLEKLKTDPIFCALMKSNFATFIPPSNVRELAVDGKEIEITRLGAVVYSSRECKKCTWYVLLSGKLKVSLDAQSKNEEEAPHCELNAGDVFGGYGIQPDTADTVHVKIETMQASKFIELSGERLGEFVHHAPEIGARLMSMMSGDSELSCLPHCLIIYLILSLPGSTWHFLTKGQHYKHDDDDGYMPFPREKGRVVQVSERERRNSQISDRDLWVTKEKKACTETELHAIKTAFGAIESLWRDISMGSDSISVNVLKSIHQQLGEIGSELFRRIFLSRGQLLKVLLYVS
jgi:hypothetical protein